jgi:hypothetical protein
MLIFGREVLPLIRDSEARVGEARQ